VDILDIDRHGLLALPNTAAAETQVDEPAATSVGHVRSRHQALRTMIATASEQSPTFRRMVETINTSDGIVYVEPGGCRHGVRACLVTVTSVGRYRFLFVKVDIVRADHEVMASISHELRHAVELLGEPRVRNLRTMYFFIGTTEEEAASRQFPLKPTRR
jgi:hypothetical protein